MLWHALLLWRGRHASVGDGYGYVHIMLMYVQHIFKSGINVSLLSAINNAHTNAYGHSQYFQKSNNQVKSTQSTGMYIMCIYIYSSVHMHILQGLAWQGKHWQGGREGDGWPPCWPFPGVLGPWDTDARQGCSECPAWPHHTHTAPGHYQPLGGSQWGTFQGECLGVFVKLWCTSLW